MTTPSLRKHYLHSYKMSLIEAGHILQLFCILAGEMNLAICEMGGINENLIVEYFNAYGKYDTVPVAAIALGEKK